MRTLTSLLLFLFFQAVCLRASDCETIVFIRHGEKPKEDKGQLTLKGLHRALALPNVLIPKYGKAQYVFAPKTELKKTAGGMSYSYVRPLMTIEPTAIRLGLPVDTRFTYDQISRLRKELLAPRYKNALIFVAWEHVKLEELLRDIVASRGGDPGIVPNWPHDDFDSIFVVKTGSANGKQTMSLRHDHEGLNESHQPSS